MQVIIDEVVTEVVVEPGPEESGRPTDRDALQELVLRLIREELARHERLEDGV